ncbi:MAG: hydrogenase maturation protease [Acidiphilium sp.]|nr:hydrogenase maturation protease [Acidiphilium sp.]MDD4937262.1 hydrogenase maturation protease [Acidiphilium sp.]
MTALAARSDLHATSWLPAIQMPRVLVLGYGNPGRQDDGLGPAAAAEIEALGWPGVTTRDNYQLVIEDVVDIAAHDVVWFVDAAREGCEPYEVRSLSPAFDITFTSHLVKPETLLAMASQYYGKSPEAYLLGIRGYQFEFIEELTEFARNNLSQAMEVIRDRIRTVLEVP